MESDEKIEILGRPARIGSPVFSLIPPSDCIKTGWQKVVKKIFGYPAFCCSGCLYLQPEFYLEQRQFFAGGASCLRARHYIKLPDFIEKRASNNLEYSPIFEKLHKFVFFK